MPDSDFNLPRRSFGPAFRREIVAIAVALLTLELAQGMGGRWFQWYASTIENSALAEGRLWWSGRLELPERTWDTALNPETGGVYNIFPPLLSIISFVVTIPFPGREDPAQFPEFLPLLLFGLPLPVVGYWAFCRAVPRPIWPVVMTLAWFGGTAMLPVTRLARNGEVYHLNHVLSQVGLMLIVAEMLTRRRLWLMLTGLVIAAWTRQLTILYAPAILFSVFLAHRENERKESHATIGDSRIASSPGRPPRSRRSMTRPTAWIAATIVIVLLVPMGLSWAKFGSPFNSGYQLIYEGREDGFATNARAHGLFSTAFLPHNARYMNTVLPDWEWDGWTPRPRVAVDGTSIWITSPLLALAWIGLPSWWRDPRRRALMMCSLPVVLGHLLYHTTGAATPGYYRFALDYIPVWLLVSADWLTTGWRRWATLASTIWSVAYFGVLCG